MLVMRSVQHLEWGVTVLCNLPLQFFPFCIKFVLMSVQHLEGLASWLPPEAGMFMWMKLEGGVKDADDIIDALKDEQVAVVPGMC